MNFASSGMRRPIRPPASSKPDPQDVRDVLEFFDFLLQYLYTLPHEIQEYRNRKNPVASP
jgi:hypothetical protein